jgi:hypothetical protein
VATEASAFTTIHGSRQRNGGATKAASSESNCHGSHSSA